MKWFRKFFAHPEVWVLTVAALLTRLWHLSVPSDIVFDEIYFRQFAADYLSGNYFFDVHPPFVKLLFAAVGALFGLIPAQVASGAAGAEVLRILPALAGAALVPLVYIIIRQFGLGRRSAVLGAVLVLCDNALLVESRFVLMDSLLLLFGLCALSCFLQLRKSTGTQRRVWVVAAAAFLGMLISTKWTGLAIAGLVGLVWVFEDVLNKHKLNWRRLISEMTIVFTIVSSVYIGSFVAHFSLLTHSGNGDAFMSEQFQSTLIDSPYYKPDANMSFWDKFIELNTAMYTAQNSLTNATHPYASRWYSWPLEVRPIYYWAGPVLSDSRQGNIYLLGNPLVWWLSTLGVVSALILWFVRPKWFGKRRKLATFLLVGYLFNFLPFVFIERPMFLYHYLFALLFSILITCVMTTILFDWLGSKYGGKLSHQLHWLLLVIIVLSFLYFLPLSYGWPLSGGDLQQHMWLQTWR